MKTSFYLQLQPIYGWASYLQEPPVTGMKAVGLTQKKPSRPVAHAVVVKLTVEMDKAVFEPFSPAATIVIPSDLVERITPPVVEAVAP